MNKRGGSNRRREVLSNPKVQIKIILSFVFLALLYVGTNYYVSNNTLKTFADHVLDLPLSERDRSDVIVLRGQQAMILNAQLYVFTLLTLLILVLGSIYLSHKIAGPIFRINKYLQSVSKGEKKPHEIHFRKYDFFDDLAENFNEFQKDCGILSVETTEKKEPPPRTV